MWDQDLVSKDVQNRRRGANNKAKSLKSTTVQLGKVVNTWPSFCPQIINYLGRRTLCKEWMDGFKKRKPFNNKHVTTGERVGGQLRATWHQLRRWVASWGPWPNLTSRRPVGSQNNSKIIDTWSINKNHNVTRNRSKNLEQKLIWPALQHWLLYSEHCTVVVFCKWTECYLCLNFDPDQTVYSVQKNKFGWYNKWVDSLIIYSTHTFHL